MVWWKNNSTGWSKPGWRNGWGQSQGQAKPTQSQSWGDWCCGECGNTQSGSQCKGCKCKWWEVSWTKPDKAKARKSTKGQAQPHTKPKEDLVRFLDMFLAKGDQSNTAMNTLAAEIREGLTADEPKVSRNNRLKSVLDKLTHKKAALNTAKSKLKSAQQELNEAEKNHDNLAIEVAALEEERTDLANQVVNQVDTDSEAPAEEQETSVGQTSEDRSEGEAQWKWTPVPKAKAWNKQQRFTQMSEEDLQELLRRARREAKRRRIHSVDDDEEADEEGEEDDISSPDMET